MRCRSVPYQTRYFALSADHPMFQGSAPGPLLQDADLVIVFEPDVPWLPSKESPPAGARVVQIGEDPLHRPPADAQLSVRPDSDRDLPVGAGGAWNRALATRATPHVADRDTRLRERSQRLHDTWRQEAEQAGQAETITLPWLNHCLRDDRRCRHEGDQRIFVPAGILPAAHARQPVCRKLTPAVWAGDFRPSLGCQAGLAGSLVRVGAGRRRLHVRQSDGLSLHRADAEPAGADDYLQQRAVWRRAARHAGHVCAGRRKRGGRTISRRPARGIIRKDRRRP